MRFIRRNAIALTALVLAMTGTGLAASRYIITSKSQIKPSVLRELRASAVVAAVPKGPRAIVDRIGLVAPTLTTSDPGEGPFERPAAPITSATWTQVAQQADAIIGQVTVTKPSQGACGEAQGGRNAFIEVLLDGSTTVIGTVIAELGQPYEAETTYQFGWVPPTPSLGDEAGATWLPDSSAARSHTISVRAVDSCQDGSHYKIEALTIDVLGFR